MRLTTITTRTGDDGTTGLADGTRLPKTHPRITALGSLDELNSILGWLRAASLPEAWDQAIMKIQHALFDLGGCLALPGAEFAAAHLEQLEAWAKSLHAELPPLREFILPGGSEAAARCHVARSVVRRAERDWCVLAAIEPVPEFGLAYLNRLSDALFSLARQLNRESQVADTLWARG